MSEFVASNGKRIKPLADGQIAIAQPVVSGSMMEYRIWAGANDAQALREFFLAERDAELGRWRSKEHPEYVAYPKRDGSVRVVLEATGEGAYHHRDLYSSALIGFEVAREFFAAHPEPKPWHDAKPGERWLLTVYGAEHEFFIRSDGGSQIFAHRLDASAEYKITGDTGVITAGRRIWPEGD